MFQVICVDEDLPIEALTLLKEARKVFHFCALCLLFVPFPCCSSCSTTRALLLFALLLQALTRVGCSCALLEGRLSSEACKNVALCTLSTGVGRVTPLYFSPERFELRCEEQATTLASHFLRHARHDFT